MIALNMQGFSLSLLNLPSHDSVQILQLLDAPTESIFWPTSMKLSKSSSQRTKCNGVQLSTLPQSSSSNLCEISNEEIFQTKNLLSLTKTICEFTLTRIKEYNKLDSEVGDGDFGDSMQRACESILRNVIEKSNNSQISLWELVYQIGLSVQNSGGSSGIIASMFFLRYSKSLKEEINHVKAFIEGVRGMMELGDTHKGDRTMLDTLIPIVDYLESQDQLDLEKIVNVAREGMEITRDILAKRGRSRYLGDRILGHLDPGAVCMFDIVKLWSLWMQDL